MREPRRRCIGVASVDFGWGGSGALANILSALRSRGVEAEVVLIGSSLGRHLLPGYVYSRHEASLPSMLRHGTLPDLVLSVLDAEIAKQAAHLDIPVVFVDLLPFLWGESQRSWVPYDADVYLAQSVAGLDSFSSILPAHAEPVEPITSPITEQMAIDDRGAMKWDCTVVLGGLLSPQQHDQDGYVRAVAPSILHFMSESGLQTVKVVGNLSADATKQISAICDRLKLRHEVGPVPPSEFGLLLRNSNLIAAQPGLMTLLEASASGRPLIRLPPQNVAGFVQTIGFNTVVSAAGAMCWPESVVDVKHILKLRDEGEEPANEYCYRQINSYTASQHWDDLPFLEDVRETFRTAQTIDTFRRQSFYKRSGSGGADQVANRVAAYLSSTAKA